MGGVLDYPLEQDMALHKVPRSEQHRVVVDVLRALLIEVADGDPLYYLVHAVVKILHHPAHAEGARVLLTRVRRHDRHLRPPLFSRGRPHTDSCHRPAFPVQNGQPWKDTRPQR